MKCLSVFMTHKVEMRERLTRALHAHSVKKSGLNVQARVNFPRSQHGQKLMLLLLLLFLLPAPLIDARTSINDEWIEVVGKR